MMKYIQAKSPYRGHCGISMNKRWLYGLYICLSKELSISRSWSLYIINLRCGSATTQHPRLASPPPVEIISLSQHFTSRTTIQNINQGTLEQQTRSILFSWAAASHKVYCEWRENLNDWRSRLGRNINLFVFCHLWLLFLFPPESGVLVYGGEELL